MNQLDLWNGVARFDGVVNVFVGTVVVVGGSGCCLEVLTIEWWVWVETVDPPSLGGRAQEVLLPVVVVIKEYGALHYLLTNGATKTRLHRTRGTTRLTEKQLDATYFIVIQCSFNAQHVSAVNTTIFRSLRLIGCYFMGCICKKYKGIVLACYL